jgi:hypothetical protein
MVPDVGLTCAAVQVSFEHPAVDSYVRQVASTAGAVAAQHDADTYYKYGVKGWGCWGAFTLCNPTVEHCFPEVRPHKLMQAPSMRK